MLKLRSLLFGYSLAVFAACPSVSIIYGIDGGDFIVEINGQVESIGFADLDGDHLRDLIVMAGSGPLEEAVPPIQVFFQNPSGVFAAAEVPDDLIQHCFMIEVGDFTSSPGDEILLVDQTELQLLAFDSGRTLSAHSTPSSINPLFYPQAHDAPYLLRYSCDLNADRHDDAMIPTQGGYAALLCDGEGSFRDPVFIPAALDWSIQSSDNVFFSLMTLFGKMHVLPLKGERPLVVLETNGWIMGYQFGAGEKGFTKLTSPTSEFGSYSPHVKQDTVEYAGIQFCDDLGNGESCFVRSHRKGQTGILSELKTTHSIYNFNIDKKLSSITPNPLQKIVTDGISAAPVFSDLNNDGYQDLVLIYVKTSILTKLLEFFLDRVVITCQSHLYQHEEGRFSFAPDWSQDIPVPTQSVRTVGTEGLVQFNGDFNGDKRPDMLIFDKDRLLIKRGESDAGWFSSKEVSFRNKPFYQVGQPFPGPVICENIDEDECPEIITSGGKIVRIVHVR